MSLWWDENWQEKIEYPEELPPDYSLWWGLDHVKAKRKLTAAEEDYMAKMREKWAKPEKKKPATRKRKTAPKKKTTTRKRAAPKKKTPPKKRAAPKKPPAPKEPTPKKKTRPKTTAGGSGAPGKGPGRGWWGPPRGTHAGSEMHASAGAQVDESIAAYKREVVASYGQARLRDGGAGEVCDSHLSNYGKSIGLTYDDGETFDKWLGESGERPDSKAAWSKLRELAVDRAITESKMVKYKGTNITLNSEHVELYRPALDAMASVHGLGKIPPVKIRATPRVTGIGVESAVGVKGAYNFTASQGKVKGEVQISKTTVPASEAAPVLAHEIGHHIDYTGILPMDPWSTDPASTRGKGDSKVQAWGNAIAKAPSRKVLRDQYSTSTYREGVRGSTVKQTQLNPYVEYLLEPTETFARSYEQWLSVRTDNTEYKRQFAARRKASEGTPGTYWGDDEFEPIAAALDGIFEDWK